MGVGGQLRAARLNAGLSLEQVSDVTKIRATLIDAIERDEFGGCGAAVYARGHVRAIAGVLGLDPAPLMTLMSPPDTGEQEPPAATPLAHAISAWWHVGRRRTSAADPATGGALGG